VSESQIGPISTLTSLHPSGSAPSTPVRSDHQGNKSFVSQSPMSSSMTPRTEPSPLKVAASLIQSLDIAHTEMSSFAADAAADAERARRNARTAQEIARRYQNRSYPTFRLDALETSTSVNESVAGAASAYSTSLRVASRPRRPEIERNDNITPTPKFAISGFKRQNGRDKDSENDGKQVIENDNYENARAYVPTPVTPKQSGLQDKASNNVPNTGAFQSPTSLERITQHHADDVLQLSMELERARQALNSEQRLRKESQSSLALLQSKKKKLENVNRKLVEKHDVERKQSAAKISFLENELEASRLKLHAAEEDAQLALDLAKDSAEERDTIEESLQKAQKEIETLKKQQDEKPQAATVESSKRSVHFADETPAEPVVDNTTSTASAELDETPSTAINTQLRQNGPPRSMIAAGRQLLLRRNMTPHDAVIRLQLSPTKSAERRQLLCQRLNEHLNDGSNDDASSSSSQRPLSPKPGSDVSTSSSINSATTKKKFEEYQNAMQILQISGKRLDLDGYWFKDNSVAVSPHSPIQIDMLTRQYCQNVEVRTHSERKALIDDSRNLFNSYPSHDCIVSSFSSSKLVISKRTSTSSSLCVAISKKGSTSTKNQRVSDGCVSAFNISTFRNSCQIRDCRIIVELLFGSQTLENLFSRTETLLNFLIVDFFSWSYLS
jgi:hypothetical protein